MKKLMIPIISALCLSSTYAQDITDALRYSQDEIKGTARFRALSGAFGALGGDMSAVSINPAGSAVFSSSHISMSLSNKHVKNETQYFNGYSGNSFSNIDLGQSGAAFVFNNRNQNSKWNKFTIGVSYEQIQDFDNDWYAYGVNPINSIDSYFLEYANGLRLDEISALPGETYSQAYSEIGSLYGYGNQQAFLGYESYILEPDDFNDDNTIYTSNISGGNYNHNYNYSSSGYNGKFTFNAAAEYNNRLYIGLNLNSHFINYSSYTYLTETNNNQGSIVSQVNFGNSLYTIGSGFSFQLGTIVKVTNGLRAGVTYNSPTWMNISDETTQYIRTVRDDNGSNVSQVIDPLIVNIYPTYRLQTPGKITGSLAYVFGNYGLISFDYSVKDYGNTKFKPKSDLYFSEQNNIINNNLRAASIYRVGAEIKLNRLSLRGGYRFEESPYKNEIAVGDLNSWSTGLGYNFNNIVKLDLSFDQSKRESNPQLYNVGLVDRANLDTTISNFTMTVVFNL
ncbi:OmpP1/FadL family transporter [Hanstruepera flava]|uniref:OmpP1/FadL family transporter n=1 Tax=Hanstruepera flava TaxID=2930218 RepID=UPI002028FC24|nr:transporter [Hanstruepera flava]